MAAGEPLAEVGHDLDPCTSTVKHFVLQRHDRDVVFVDTPGFNHTSKTDGVILEEIINGLKSELVLSRFLYYTLIFHQILPRHAIWRYYLSAWSLPAPGRFKGKECDDTYEAIRSWNSPPCYFGNGRREWLDGQTPRETTKGYHLAECADTTVHKYEGLRLEHNRHPSWHTYHQIVLR